MRHGRERRARDGRSGSPGGRPHGGAGARPCWRGGHRRCTAVRACQPTIVTAMSSPSRSSWRGRSFAAAAAAALLPLLPLTRLPSRQLPALVTATSGSTSADGVAPPLPARAPDRRSVLLPAAPRCRPAAPRSALLLPLSWRSTRPGLLRAPTSQRASSRSYNSCGQRGVGGGGVGQEGGVRGRHASPRARAGAPPALHSQGICRGDTAPAERSG